MRLLLLLALVGLAGWLLHALLVTDGPASDLPAFDDEPRVASAPAPEAAGDPQAPPRHRSGPRFPPAAAWAGLPLAGPAHGLPPAIDLHEIQEPSDAMWQPTGAWLLDRLATHFPELPVAFRDAEAVEALRAQRWPQPFPGRMHLGMLVMGLPDVGFRAVHHRGTLYILSLEDADRLQADAPAEAE